MRVVATAGHVDHGKSSLVLALTGTDPDRFPEEKARGLTIDLGFAFCTLPSGRTIGFVDVPGHVRFLKNMLAGVGAVDVAVLVVAATEGWMPQTEEHVQILDLLDVRTGVVAVTKAALVDDDTCDLVRLDVEERLGALGREWAVVPVDSPTGTGVPELARALDDAIAAAPPPADTGRPRLWVDRVFAAKGAGTVVTGTLTGGALTRDDEVVVGDRSCRVRRIESHGEQCDHIGPGARVALNLAGIDHHAIGRGDAVVRPGQWTTTAAADVRLRPVPGGKFPTRAEVQVHAGSGEQRARLRVLEPAADGSGTHLARLTFSAPLPLAPGDRIVVRSSGARATLGGATVLDVAPARRRADAVARAALPLAARVLTARPWCTPAEFAALAGRDARPGEAAEVGSWLVEPGELTRVRERAAECARDGWPPITTVAAACGVEVAQLRAALGDAIPDSPLDDPAAPALLAALDAQPFSPPAPAELGSSPELVRALVRAGALVDLDGVLFTTGALDLARRAVVDALAERGELTVADIRDVLGSTRKYVLPIANRLDREGVTRRRGDVRIAGPRAAPADGTGR